MVRNRSSYANELRRLKAPAERMVSKHWGCAGTMSGAYDGEVPEIEFAFLADAAETLPAHKFHVLGGGVSRIGGRTFPVRHPHVALVIGLLVTTPELEREHEIRFVLLDPDGGEVATGTGSVVARGAGDGRDSLVTFSVDLWNLTFPAPGDYSVRILVNGSERKRLPLVIFQAEGPMGMPSTQEPPGGTPRFDA